MELFLSFWVNITTVSDFTTLARCYLLSVRLYRRTLGNFCLFWDAFRFSKEGGGDELTVTVTKRFAIECQT